MRNQLKKHSSKSRNPISPQKRIKLPLNMRVFQQQIQIALIFGLGTELLTLLQLCQAVVQRLHVGHLIPPLGRQGKKVVGAEIVFWIFQDCELVNQVISVAQYVEWTADAGLVEGFFIQEKFLRKGKNMKMNKMI